MPISDTIGIQMSMVSLTAAIAITIGKRLAVASAVDAF
jgi:hypothetical protein